MTKDRLDRIKDFDEFYKTAYVTFNEFLNIDKRVKDFKEICLTGRTYYPLCRDTCTSVVLLMGVVQKGFTISAYKTLLVH